MATATTAADYTYPCQCWTEYPCLCMPMEKLARVHGYGNPTEPLCAVNREAYIEQCVHLYQGSVTREELERSPDSSLCRVYLNGLRWYARDQGMHP